MQKENKLNIYDTPHANTIRERLKNYHKLFTSTYIYFPHININNEKNFTNGMHACLVCVFKHVPTIVVL